MPWQSPISPGYSWYEATVPDRPEYPAMPGSRKANVAIVGGGYTGLQAAWNLARQGVDVTLIDACRFGDGASGRNGGQFGTGQRAWADETETSLGHERAQALFDMAENAKRYVLDFASAHEIDIEFVPGQLSVGHKKSLEKDYRDHAEAMATRFGYPHLSFMDREETASRLGSSHYHFGIRDAGTGHIHPMKLLVGLAKQAALAGANLFEQTKAPKIDRQSGHDRHHHRPRHDHCRSRACRLQRLYRQSRAGERQPRHADPLLHRRNDGAFRPPKGHSRRRIGR